MESSDTPVPSEPPVVPLLPARRSILDTVRRWPGTRIALVVVPAVVVVGALVNWLMQSSPNAAFAVTAHTGILTVAPLCGERLVWDLPPGRLAGRSAMPGTPERDEGRFGPATLVLLPGARARLESREPRVVRISVAQDEAIHRACTKDTTAPFYEMTVDKAPVPDDRFGITYDTTPTDVAEPLSLMLSGHVVLGAAVQLGGGWGSRADVVLESATLDLRVIPWFGRDRVTLRTERLETGSLFDTHACLETQPRTTCPDPGGRAARGFVRLRPDGGMDAQLFARGPVGAQPFGGDQSIMEISKSTAAWHSPIVTTVGSVLVALFALYQGIMVLGRDCIKWWKGSKAAGVIFVVLAATPAWAEPVEIRQGTYVGAGYSFRRGATCLVVTARHVVPQIGMPVTVSDRTGAQSEGSRAYENEFYDLALVTLPDRTLVACSTPWPDATWIARASFSSRNEFRAVRHYPTGRETIVRLQHAGGVKHLLTLAPVDKLTIRESDSGAIVELDGRPVGIVQSVDAATDRVSVLRFDTIDQLVGDRFRGTSTGPVSFVGVLSRGRPNAAWSTYVQSWLTEKAGRSVLPAAGGGGRRGSPAVSPTVCEVKVDVLAWERVQAANPDWSAVELQLKACGRRGFLFEQTCQAGRRAAQTTPRMVLSQKLTINTTVTPPNAPVVTKLETTTHMPPSGPPLGRAELELYVLQAAAGPALQDLLGRGHCP